MKESENFDSFFSSDLDTSIGGYDATPAGEGNTEEILDKLEEETKKSLTEKIEDVLSDKETLIQKVRDSEKTKDLREGRKEREIQDYMDFYPTVGIALTDIMREESGAEAAFVHAGKSNKNWLNQAESILHADSDDADQEPADVLFIIMGDDPQEGMSAYKNAPMIRLQERLKDYPEWKILDGEKALENPKPRNVNDEAWAKALGRVVTLVKKDS